MRILQLAMLCMALVSAQWPAWEHSKLCDNQDEIEAFDTEDPAFSLDECSKQCQRMDMEHKSTNDGPNEMCCEYAAYKGGSFSCSLYKGSETSPQDFNVYTNEQFSAFGFQHLQFSHISRVLQETAQNQSLADLAELAEPQTPPPLLSEEEEIEDAEVPEVQTTVDAETFESEETQLEGETGAEVENSILAEPSEVENSILAETSSQNITSDEPSIANLELQNSTLDEASSSQATTASEQVEEVQEWVPDLLYLDDEVLEVEFGFKKTNWIFKELTNDSFYSFKNADQSIPVQSAMIETFSNNFSSPETNLSTGYMSQVSVCGVDNSKYWRSNRLVNQTMSDQCSNRELKKFQSTNSLPSVLQTVDKCNELVLTPEEGCITSVKVAWYVSNNSAIIHGLEFQTSSGSEKSLIFEDQFQKSEPGEIIYKDISFGNDGNQNQSNVCMVGIDYQKVIIDHENSTPSGEKIYDTFFSNMRFIYNERENSTESCQRVTPEKLNELLKKAIMKVMKQNGIYNNFENSLSLIRDDLQSFENIYKSYEFEKEWVIESFFSQTFNLNGPDFADSMNDDAIEFSYSLIKWMATGELFYESSNSEAKTPVADPRVAEKCAAQKGKCQCPNGSTIFYGAISSIGKLDRTQTYESRQAHFSGSTFCDSGVFGDPLPDEDKYCFCDESTVKPVYTQDEFCGIDGETCQCRRGTYATYGEMTLDKELNLTQPSKKKLLEENLSFEFLNPDLGSLNSMTFECSSEFFDVADSGKACFCENPSQWYGNGYCENDGIETYEGCFYDAITDRDFEILISDGVGSIQECLDLAFENRYLYAGLQAGNECWVSNIPPGRHGVAFDCNYKCSGDGNNCGGRHSNSIYRLSHYKDTICSSMFFYQGLHSDNSTGDLDLSFTGIGYGAAHLVNSNGDGKNFIWTDADDNKRVFTPDRNELGQTQGFFISDLTNNEPLVNYLPQAQIELSHWTYARVYKNEQQELMIESPKEFTQRWGDQLENTQRYGYYMRDFNSADFVGMNEWYPKAEQQFIPNIVANSSCLSKSVCRQAAQEQGLEFGGNVWESESTKGCYTYDYSERKLNQPNRQNWPFDGMVYFGAGGSIQEMEEEISEQNADQSMVRISCYSQNYDNAANQYPKIPINLEPIYQLNNDQNKAQGFAYMQESNQFMLIAVGEVNYQNDLLTDKKNSLVLVSNDFKTFFPTKFSRGESYGTQWNYRNTESPCILDIDNESDLQKTLSYQQLTSSWGGNEQRTKWCSYLGGNVTFTINTEKIPNELVVNNSKTYMLFDYNTYKTHLDTIESGSINFSDFQAGGQFHDPLMYIKNQTNVEGFYYDGNGTKHEFSNETIYSPSNEFIKFTSNDYYVEQERLEEEEQQRLYQEEMQAQDEIIARQEEERLRLEAERISQQQEADAERIRLQEEAEAERIRLQEEAAEQASLIEAERTRQPDNALRTSLRLTGNFSDFNEEAQQSFETKLILGLGIEESQLNVIGYEEGSIIATYDVITQEGQSLDQLASAQASSFANNIDLGYPIEDVLFSKPGDNDNSATVDNSITTNETATSDNTTDTNNDNPPVFEEPTEPSGPQNNETAPQVNTTDPSSPPEVNTTNPSTPGENITDPSNPPEVNTTDPYTPEGNITDPSSPPEGNITDPSNPPEVNTTDPSNPPDTNTTDLSNSTTFDNSTTTNETAPQVNTTDPYLPPEVNSTDPSELLECDEDIDYLFSQENPNYWLMIILSPSSTQEDLQIGGWESIDSNLEEFHYSTDGIYCYGKFIDGYINILGSTPPPCIAQYFSPNSSCPYALDGSAFVVITYDENDEPLSLTGPDGEEWNAYSTFEELQNDLYSLTGFDWRFINYDEPPLFEQQLMTLNGLNAISLMTYDPNYKHWLYIDSKGNVCDAVSNRNETLNPERQSVCYDKTNSTIEDCNCYYSCGSCYYDDDFQSKSADKQIQALYILRNQYKDKCLTCSEGFLPPLNYLGLNKSQSYERNTQNGMFNDYPYAEYPPIWHESEGKSRCEAPTDGYISYENADYPQPLQISGFNLESIPLFEGEGMKCDVPDTDLFVSARYNSHSGDEFTLTTFSDGLYQNQNFTEVQDCEYDSYRYIQKQNSTNSSDFMIIKTCDCKNFELFDNNGGYCELYSNGFEYPADSFENGIYRFQKMFYRDPFGTCPYPNQEEIDYEIVSSQRQWQSDGQLSRGVRIYVSEGQCVFDDSQETGTKFTGSDLVTDWLYFTEEEFNGSDLSSGQEPPQTPGEQECLIEDAVITSYFYKDGLKYFGQWISCDGTNFEYRDQNDGLCKGVISSTFQEIEIRDVNGSCPYPQVQNSSNTFALTLTLDSQGTPTKMTGPDGQFWDFYSEASEEDMLELVKQAWNVTESFSWYDVDTDLSVLEAYLIDQNFPQNSTFVIPILLYDPDIIDWSQFWSKESGGTVYKIGYGDQPNEKPCQAVLNSNGSLSVGDLSLPGFEGSCRFGNYTAQTGQLENVNNGQAYTTGPNGEILYVVSYEQYLTISQNGSQNTTDQTPESETPQQDDVCETFSRYIVKSDSNGGDQPITTLSSEFFGCLEWYEQPIVYSDSQGGECEFKLAFSEDLSDVWYEVQDGYDLCPYTMVSMDKVQIIFADEQQEDAVGIEGSWGNSTYWMFVEDEEFFEFYYDGGQSLVQEEEVLEDEVVEVEEEEVEEETIQYEDYSDLIVTPTYDILEFYGIGDESDLMQITYIVTVDFETFDYYDYNGAYCVLYPNWQGAQIVSLIVDPTCQYYGSPYNWREAQLNYDADLNPISFMGPGDNTLTIQESYEL